jgi:hypothetical protein
MQIEPKTPFWGTYYRDRQMERGSASWRTDLHADLHESICVSFVAFVCFLYSQVISTLRLQNVKSKM